MYLALMDVEGSVIVWIVQELGEGDIESLYMLQSSYQRTEANPSE